MIILGLLALAPLLATSTRVADAEWSLLEARDLGQTAASNNMFYEAPTTRGRFVLVGFEVTSLLSKPDRIYRHPRIRDSQARQFDPADHQSFLVPRGKKTIEGESLPPGVPKEFWAVYEVAADSAGLEFEARTMSAFGDAVWIKIPVGARVSAPAPKKARQKARSQESSTRGSSAIDTEPADPLGEPSIGRSLAYSVELCLPEMIRKAAAKMDDPVAAQKLLEALNEIQPATESKKDWFRRHGVSPSSCQTPGAQLVLECYYNKAPAACSDVEVAEAMPILKPGWSAPPSE